jgi:hypothetical protein
MVKKLIVTFAILALAVAVAGTVSGPRTNFKIVLAQPSVVSGTEFKAGECRLMIGDSKITLEQGKQSVVVPAKIENVENKYDVTAIRYSAQGEKQIMGEIRLGGTKTKITLQ